MKQVAVFAAWYAWLGLAGWVFWPLVWRLLPGLPSRGWPYRRVLALVTWGYLFWLPTALGWTPNTPATMVSALLALGLPALAWARKHRRRMFRWWTQEAFRALTTEFLFLVGLVGWAVVRAANPEAFSTEKPMEMAFINAILRSPTFPPLDPWLSGYAISYYYFGYVLVAMLGRLSGAPGSMAFNLGLATVFALAVEVSAGLVWDLATRRSRRVSPVALLLGPLFVLIIGNWEAVLEVLHARGVFWNQVRGVWTSRFWTWTQIPALMQPPRPPLRPVPSRFWWWWQASRVVQDYTPAGQRLEVIDEFPFFSFLLGDLHPHVLSIPFLLTWLALMYNLYRGGFRGPWLGWHRPAWVLLPLYLGGLTFLNAWDGPTALVLLVLVTAWRHGTPHRGWQGLALAGVKAFLVAVLSFLLYLPYHLGFSSQVRGVLPNLLFPSRGFHLWIMFGPLFVPLFLGLWALARRQAGSLGTILRQGLTWAMGLWLLLNLASWLLAVMMWFQAAPQVMGALQQVGAGSLGDLVSIALARRVSYGFGALTLALLFAGAVGLALHLGRARPRAPVGFLALLTAWAAVLVWLPDHLYVWDVFGTRMNTVFKFYYQAWQMWAVVAAVWTLTLVRDPRAWLGLSPWMVMLSLAAALVYPVLSLPGRMAEGGWAWTLDSLDLVARQNPEEAQAIRWLRQAPLGVVAEAVGGSYSRFARMATFSGQPAVLGWPGHEIQWRGSAKPLGSREDDIARLYTADTWEAVRAILDRYGIRYVVVGGLERGRYPGLNQVLLEQHLPLVFRGTSVLIFGYTPP